MSTPEEDEEQRKPENAWLRKALKRMDAKYEQLAHRLLGAIVILVVATTIGFAIQHHQSGQIASVVRLIQSERLHNTITSCEQKDAANATIQGFIFAITPPRQRNDPQTMRFLALTQKTFPTHPNAQARDRFCVAQASQTVKPVHLP